METDRAIEIVQALADGVAPFTGERFPSSSPYQQADTVLNLKRKNGGLAVCNDEITLTCVKINLALVAYRSPVNIVGFDFNHAALITGYGGTGPYGIDAPEGSGKRTKTALTTYFGQYHILEMPGQDQPAIPSNLYVLLCQHTPSGWPGASHEYLVSNPILATQDTVRIQILDYAETVQGVTSNYCWENAVEGLGGDPDWDGDINHIENLRCDGLVEVVYELAGVEVWGRNWTHFPIQTWPLEHNDIGMTPSTNRLSPIVQRAGLVGSPTRFTPQPLVEPSTMEPHE